MNSKSVAFAINVLVLLSAGCGMEDRDLTIIVSPEEPAPAIAESIQSSLEEHGYSISLQVAANPEEVIDAVQRRKVDLAVVEEPVLPTPGAVTLVPLYPNILHVLHNRPETPRGFVDLIRGANVYAGAPGGAAHRLLMRLLSDFGVTPEQYRLLNKHQAVSPDVYFTFEGLLSKERIEKLSGYRLFSFADTSDVVGSSVADGIALKYHHLKPFLLPEGTYNSLHTDAVVTLSIRSVLITHADLDNGIAYEVVSHLYDNAHEIALNYPMVTRELHSAVSEIDLMLPLHADTRRFLDRDKPGFIERYADVMALAFTIIITMLSGAFAIYRYRLQIKKDRMDKFNSQLLAIQAEMADMSASEELRSGRKQTLEVQRTVMNLLIDERIVADTSLMAFLSLANQIISDFDRRICHGD